MSIERMELERRYDEDMVGNAEHYVALGYKRCRLTNEPEKDWPWHLVTEVREEYGSGFPHELLLIAPHPSGLIFEWTVRIPTMRLHGEHFYDRESVRAFFDVLSAVPADSVRKDAVELIRNAISARRAMIDEWTAALDVIERAI